MKVAKLLKISELSSGQFTRKNIPTAEPEVGHFFEEPTEGRTFTLWLQNKAHEPSRAYTTSTITNVRKNKDGSFEFQTQNNFYTLEFIGYKSD